MKEKIPKALREQVWLTHVGKQYEAKCSIVWCKNNITVFDFQSGHNIPESKGGSTDLANLLPICSRCNSSMNDNYTIDEWSKLSKPVSRWNLFWAKLNCNSKCKLFATKENGTQSSPNPMNQKDKHIKFHGILSANRILPRKKPTGNGTRKSKKM